MNQKLHFTSSDQVNNILTPHLANIFGPRTKSCPNKKITIDFEHKINYTKQHNCILEKTPKFIIFAPKFYRSCIKKEISSLKQDIVSFRTCIL